MNAYDDGTERSPCPGCLVAGRDSSLFYPTVARSSSYDRKLMNTRCISCFQPLTVWRRLVNGYRSETHRNGESTRVSKALMVHATFVRDVKQCQAAEGHEKGRFRSLSERPTTRLTSMLQTPGMMLKAVALFAAFDKNRVGDPLAGTEAGV